MNAPVRSLPTSPLADRFNVLLRDIYKTSPKADRPYLYVCPNSSVKTFRLEAPRFVHNTNLGWQVAFLAHAPAESRLRGHRSHPNLMESEFEDTVWHSPAMVRGRHICAGVNSKEILAVRSDDFFWNKTPRDAWSEDPFWIFSHFFKDKYYGESVWMDIYALLEIIQKTKIRNEVSSEDIAKLECLPQFLVCPFLEDMLKMPFHWQELGSKPELLEFSLRLSADENPLMPTKVYKL